MFRILFISICSLFSLAAMGQISLTAQGKVVSQESNEPLAFATVYEQNTRQAAYTDAQGNFRLDLPTAETYYFEIRHIGFELLQQEVPAEALSQITFTMLHQPFLMEEILVVQSGVQTTAQSDILTDPSRQFSQPKDIADLFADVPGFGLVKRGGYAMDPVFRSFRNEQLNVQYDGGIQVMHACPNRMDPITTHVNPEEVEKMEIIRGPFSVRYGQTMGGIMNIITGRSGVSDNFQMGGSVSGGYEFNGAGKTTRLEVHGGNRAYDFSLSGGWRDAENYQNGDGLEIPTAYTSYDYAAKAGWSLSKDHRLQAGWRQSFGRDILHVALPMDTEFDNSSVASLDYEGRNLGPLLYSIKMKGFYSYVDHLMTNDLRPNFMMTESSSSVQAVTAGGKLELAFTPKPKWQLYAGLDARLLGREGDRERLVKRNMMTGEPLPEPKLFVDEVWQNAQINDYGLFAENKLFVSDKLSLTAGLRVDWVTASINDPAADFEALYGDLTPREDWTLGGSMSANYGFSDNWKLQLSLGRGTRTANMEERYINHFNLGLDAYEYVGNPNLVPEANHQAELSVEGKWNRLGLKASAFYSYLTNYITASVDTTLSRKYMPHLEPKHARRFQNIDAATQYGGELSLNYGITANLQVYGTAAYTYAQNLDWNEPLPEIPPFMGTVGIKYENALWNADLRSRFAARQDRIATSFDEGATPGFTVVDLRAAVRPFEGLSIGGGVLNIFDVTYYEHLSRGYRNMPEQGLIWEPGRNVTVYVKYEW